jgi:hypothetical protein
MTIAIGGYSICDGTLSGGVALSETRIPIERITDIVTPLNVGTLTTYNRTTHKTDLTFTVRRTHSSVENCEVFILELDNFLPTTGTVTVICTDTLIPVTRTIPNGAVLDHQLQQQLGATSFHTFHIVGGAPVT